MLALYCPYCDKLEAFISIDVTACACCALKRIGEAHVALKSDMFNHKFGVRK